MTKASSSDTERHARRIKGQLRVAGPFESFEKLNQAAARVTYLSEAARVLASSIDLEQTFGGLTESLVPAIADACLITLVHEDGISRDAFKHVDPSGMQIMHELTRLYPLRPDSERGTAHAIRSRETELVERADELPPEADDWYRETVRRMEILSYITVPLLTSSGKTVGAIWLATTRYSGRRLGENEADLVNDLSVLAAQAVHHASLYRHARNKVEQLEVRQGVRADFVRRHIHDVKTPLTAAALALELLGKKPEDSETPKRLRVALDNVKRASAMVDDLGAIENSNGEGEEER